MPGISHYYLFPGLLLFCPPSPLTFPLKPYNQLIVKAEQSLLLKKKSLRGGMNEEFNLHKDLSASDKLLYFPIASY